jgi:putative DNA primase/helicase
MVPAFPEEADEGLASNNKLNAATIAIDDHAEIKRLAKLSPFEYSRTRKDAAKRLGVTVAALDQVVSQHRKRADEESATLPHWQVEPWPDAVPPAALLDSIVAVFNRYIVLPKYAVEALALWILHAWTFNAGDISPFVVLTSSTKRCGKTSVLILLNWLTPRSELASNISPSAIFRYVEEHQPCLLIDEADSFLKSSEEARGILNSGHTKVAAYVIRNVEIGGDHKPQRSRRGHRR